VIQTIKVDGPLGRGQLRTHAVIQHSSEEAALDVTRRIAELASALKADANKACLRVSIDEPPS